MRVGIIGGYGKMGQWLCNNLSGCEMAIYGRDFKKTCDCARKLSVNAVEDIEGLLAFVDVIMVSVPLVQNAVMLEKIRDLIPPGKMICDIASLKSESVRVLSTYPDYVAVSSIHPMFGPGSPGFKGKKVVIVPIETREKESDFFCTFFQEQGASVIVSDAVTHDRMMALTLSLPHFYGYLFSSLIADHPLESIRQFEGTSFKYLLTFSEAVLQEDPQFYFELMQNPQFKPVLEDMLEKVKTLKTIVTSGDQTRFLHLVTETRKALEAEDLSKAYELFCRLTR